MGYPTQTIWEFLEHFIDKIMKYLSLIILLTGVQYNVLSQKLNCFHSDNRLFDFVSEREVPIEFYDSLLNADCKLLKQLKTQSHLDSISRSWNEFSAAVSCGLINVLISHSPEFQDLRLRIFENYDDFEIKLSSFYQYDSAIYRVTSYIDLAEKKICIKNRFLLDKKEQFRINRIDQILENSAVFSNIDFLSRSGDSIYVIFSYLNEEEKVVLSMDLDNLNERLRSHVYTLTK